VLLSSLRGAELRRAAVPPHARPLFRSPIRIEGVRHEFSSREVVRGRRMPPMRLRAAGDGPHRGRHPTRPQPPTPGEVTAAQIATSRDIDVINPGLVLCHLDEGRKNKTTKKCE
jgi:DNA-directed RNA polymerase alpha subunit